jgi:hypothetical protein
MGYSSDGTMVRVDFFKPSGKWYTTEAVSWAHWSRVDDEGRPILIDDAFSKVLSEHLQRHSIRDRRCTHCGQSGANGAGYCEKAPYRLAGMTAVCLEPYFDGPFPLMTKVPGGGGER